MIVLITGSNGFIGRHLVLACLSKGFHVFGLDIHSRPAIKHPALLFSYLQCDILNAALFEEILISTSPGIIFNLAANVDVFSSSPVSYSVNYLPLFSIFKYLKNSQATLVQCSSMLVCQYGNVTDSTDFSDRPSTLYGYSKLIAEQLILLHISQGIANIRIARLTTVWGEGMYGPIVKLFAPSRLLLTSSSFKGKKTFCYVKNCCEDLISLALYQGSLPSVSLIGDPEYMSSYEFISIIHSQVKSTLPQPSTLLDIPYPILKFCAILLDIFPSMYRYFHFNSFHLSNLVDSNIAAPLFASFNPSPRIPPSQAVRETIQIYSHTCN